MSVAAQVDFVAEQPVDGIRYSFYFLGDIKIT